MKFPRFLLLLLTTLSACFLDEREGTPKRPRADEAQQPDAPTAHSPSTAQPARPIESEDEPEPTPPPDGSGSDDGASEDSPPNAPRDAASSDAGADDPAPDDSAPSEPAPHDVTANEPAPSTPPPSPPRPPQPTELPVERPDGDPDTRVAINEVACRGTEFVEVINRGQETVDLGRFAIADHDRPQDASPLTGTLAAGERAAFELQGLACDGDAAVLFDQGRVIDRVWPPLMITTASFARLPDGNGPFAQGTRTPNQVNRALVDEAARMFLDLSASVPSSLPEIHITLSATDEASLRGVSAGSARPWLEASLTFRDSRGEVGPISTGLRLKGQSVFRDIDGKAAFRLDFDRFDRTGHLFGVEKLTLNNFVQDASASHERLYYGLLARQGGAAPRVGYVNVWVNDQPFGVYLALESSDEPGFLGRSFTSTQLLYEGEYGADLYSGRQDNFDQDYGDDPDRAALRRVIDVLNAASDETLLEDTDAVIDWARVVPQLATDLFTGHFDSYTANRNNFTFHLDDQGRLAVISGGADQAFNQLVDRNVDGGQLLERCLRNAACTNDLDDALRSVAADTRAYLDAGAADRLRADATRLTTAFEADPRTEWDSRRLEEIAESMISFLETAAGTN